MIPATIPNLIDGKESTAASTFAKLDPASGKELCKAARSGKSEIEQAVAAAKRAQPAWAETTAVARGDRIRAAAILMRERITDLATIVHRETGKSMKDATGETTAAIDQGLFVAGEGRRLFGRTTHSAVANKVAITVRQPVGVCGLIVPANTPIANCAWKAFPALLCGNAAVLKSAEDAPATAWAFAKILHEVGVPAGVLNVVHGLGEEAGAPLVEHRDVDLVSFTGSTEVGILIQRACAARLAKVCIEAGGKNPLIVCDDADLAGAVEAAVLSAFSNAGQRCAAGSRVIVFDAVYDRFKEMLLDRTAQLKLGTADTDDLGPVINEEQLTHMLSAVKGARLLCGGERVKRDGFYMAPTWIEGGDELSARELFGPISVLYRVKGFDDALKLANDSPYGLTAAVHTADVNRAMTFLAKIRSGVAVVNGATYGSEPHMPFGGLKLSGNGAREAGTEALDVYSEWKTIYVNYKP